MNWDDFDAFCQVIAHGGFTVAARAIDRPKSSLSASVARLELQLGVQLLERTTRRVRLTEAGEALYRGISKPFGELREIALEALAKGDAVRGMLSIAAPYEFGAHHLANLASDMMIRYPELKINVDVLHQKIDLIGRNYDIVFSPHDHPLSSTTVVMRRVFSLERGLFAAPELLSKFSKPVRPEDITAMPLIAGPEDFEWMMKDAKGLEFSVPIAAPRMRSANAGIRLRAAIAGVGIVRITRSFCQPAVDAGQLAPLLPDFSCEPLRIFAFMPSRRLRPAKVRVFLDSLTLLSETYALNEARP
ncbi:LysR family transcriptional regulator [Variovorax sp. YR216]|uniref:LysR family transcriptional regulator n=1 Tax=Variovorax sp. YR216 TaxID=1882828 RepID=UPI000895EAEA|nr:LysR family transcriptional regulator [Variovorax sp. YR216]SEA04702.1 transcriptional regulator, LysR family [Variovorax sp. YR216]